MKTKLYWLALIASASLAAPAHADSRQNSSGNTTVATRGSSRGGSSARSFHSMPHGSFYGGRPVMSGQRFSPMGTRPPAFRRPYVNRTYVNPNMGAPIGQRFTPRTIDRPGTFNGDVGLTRFANPNTGLSSVESRRFAQTDNANRSLVTPNGGAPTDVNPNRSDSGDQAVTAKRPNRTEGLSGLANRNTRALRAEDRRSDRLGQTGNVNRGLNTRRDHVFARRTADWHSDWDRHHDHWWHGHRCRFINGSWVIFDLNFYPWWPYDYPYYGSPYYGYDSDNNYPSDYYAGSDYYPQQDYSYGYDPRANDNGAYDEDEYYDRGGYNSPDQNSDRTVADAQTQLAKDGYYQGEVDGVIGHETRRAIASFQSDHGLRVTGNLNQETLATLGLQ